MRDFRSHAGRRGRREQRCDGTGGKSGFFLQLAGGGGGEGFSGEFRFVTDETGGNFYDWTLHGDAILLDENDFLIVGDRQNADGGIGVRASDKFPVAALLQDEPARGE